jgi:hypothetical protein
MGVGTIGDGAAIGEGAVGATGDGALGIGADGTRGAGGAGVRFLGNNHLNNLAKKDPENALTEFEGTADNVETEVFIDVVVMDPLYMYS